MNIFEAETDNIYMWLYLHVLPNSKNFSTNRAEIQEIWFIQIH